jgi:L,D-peptidoglycan transpeptidase YkuD (ErfK/YbiS/YcfS/YnhG family)
MKLLNYFRSSRVDRLIFVKYTGGTRANVVMWKKYNAGGKMRWEKIVSCSGYVGKNGIGKTREGDMRTPTGGFPITKAFGRRRSPCTAGIAYTVLNPYLYWSGEPGTYNTLVDSRRLGHVPSNSEHLIDYDPAYNYALAIGYNPGNIVGKGSAIFLRCAAGEDTFTGGSVAIPEENMKTVMEMVHPSCAVVLDTKANLEHIAETPEKKPETEAAPVGQEYTAFDGNGNIQGKLILHSDGYYYSNDSQRYRDNGDGSYYGVDTGDTLYMY